MAETRRTVVVVDDVVDVRRLVRLQLELSGGFEVVAEGSDGVEAVECAGRCRPDLVLLDISMPRMDGLEALPRIRDASPSTQVVMFTGFAEQGLAARALELGAAGLIEKSVSLDTLADQLQTISEHPSGPDAQDASEPGRPSDRDVGEAMLAEHLERFREVFEEAAIGMATVTLTGRIVRINKALATLVGREVGELVGLPYRDLSASGASAVTHALAMAQEGAGRVARVEHEVAVLSGRQRWLSTTVAPVKDERGRPLYLFLQAQDVTAQRGAEEALRQSEDRYRFLVDAVQDYAIFMLSTDGRVESWNAGAARIKGYSGEEIIGQNFRVFYPEDMQRRRHPEHELSLALRDGRYEEEGWRVRKDGSRFWANVLITPVYDGVGRHIGFAKVTRNIDERRQMLLDLEKAGSALAEANSELETANQRLRQEAADQAQFLAVTAHELRNPVSVLSGSATLLVQHWSGMDDAERDELSASITTTAARLQRLLADLLTASRLDSNAVALELGDVDLVKLLAGTVAAARTAVAGADIQLDVQPGLRVVADAGRLAQMVDNLIANAVAHGEPPVRVGARRDGATVQITVADSGPGVPAELRPRLFERFAAGSRHGGHGGTGLGLFIVRELARAHGGDAWYAPTPASGACFALSLPATAPDPDRLTDGTLSVSWNQA